MIYWYLNKNKVSYHIVERWSRDPRICWSQYFWPQISNEVLLASVRKKIDCQFNPIVDKKTEAPAIETHHSLTQAAKFIFQGEVGQ